MHNLNESHFHFARKKKVEIFGEKFIKWTDEKMSRFDLFRSFFFRLQEALQRNAELASSSLSAVSTVSVIYDVHNGDRRPANLVRSFGELYSVARLETLDALDAIDELLDAEELKNKLLFSVVVVSIYHYWILILTKEIILRKIQGSVQSQLYNCFSIFVFCLLVYELLEPPDQQQTIV